MISFFPSMLIHFSKTHQEWLELWGWWDLLKFRRDNSLKILPQQKILKPLSSSLNTLSLGFKILLLYYHSIIYLSGNYDIIILWHPVVVSKHSIVYVAGFYTNLINKGGDWVEALMSVNSSHAQEAFISHTELLSIHKKF